MRFLLFISLAFGLLAGCSPKVVPASNSKSDLYFWLPQLRDSTQKNSYHVALSKDKATISGIWIVKRIDQSWRGTMVNEFGLKMFDFTCTANACELKNAVAMMNKWYIKKTIAGDVQFILEVDNPIYKTGQAARRSWSNDTLTIAYKNEKILQRLASGEMVMYNKKRNLTYSFKKMDK